MTEIIFQCLQGAAPMIAIIPAAIGLYHIRSLPIYLKALVIIFVLFFLRDFAQLVIIINGGRNTLWVSNLHVVIELIPIAVLFYYLGFNNRNLKKIAMGIIVIGSLLVFSNTFFYNILEFEKYYNYKFFAFATSHVMIIVVSLIYLYDFANYSTLEILNIPKSVILALGFCFYYSLTVGISIIDDQFTSNSRRLIWIWRSLLFIGYCFFATTLFLKSVRFNKYV